MSTLPDIKAIATSAERLSFRQLWTRLDGTECELHRALYAGDGALRLARADRDTLERSWLTLLQALVLAGEDGGR
jgi:hypothetical protein